MNLAFVRAAEHVPGLRRLPLARLVVIADLAILAKSHLDRLTPAERRRLLILLRDARCLPRNMSGSERREFERLIEKLGPRRFVDAAAERFSPIGGMRRRS